MAAEGGEGVGRRRRRKKIASIKATQPQQSTLNSTPYLPPFPPFYYGPHGTKGAILVSVVAEGFFEIAI